MTAHQENELNDVAELEFCITNLAGRAKREFPRVGNAEHPTPWDTRHATINDRLTEWEAARAYRPEPAQDACGLPAPCHKC